MNSKKNLDLSSLLSDINYICQIILFIILGFIVWRRPLYVNEFLQIMLKRTYVFLSIGIFFSIVKNISNIFLKIKSKYFNIILTALMIIFFIIVLINIIIMLITYYNYY
ncbi:MAG TPA: hypothetical protein DHV55_01860 [Clostridiaceae bacterium]|nr:hypothetical protein [Clostridiaceae bacterium]